MKKKPSKRKRTPLPKREKRYQHCAWYVRLWRRRHYLGIPLEALDIWWHNGAHRKDREDDWPISFKLAWSIAIGSAQGRMGWYYNWKEVFGKTQKQSMRELNKK